MPRSAEPAAECALAVFAKAPVPGAVKTRLVPPLTPARAARLHEALLQDTLRRVAALPWPRYLACAPTTRHPFLAACARRYGAVAIAQGSGDLGARMRRITRALLARHARVILIGTDSPTVPLAYLERARSALNRVDLVFGPSDDGGYYLLGQRRLEPRIFTGIPWGTSDVLAQTLAKLDTDVRLLPPWYDVDRPSDLDRLRHDLPGTPECTATRALLASWDRHARPRGSSARSYQP